MTPGLGIVLAMDAEARALLGRARHRRQAAAGRRVAVSGMGRQAALDAARLLVASGASALACVGVAGGLDPRLAAGDLVLATAVVDVGQRWACSEDFVSAVAAALSDAGLSPVRGSVAAATGQLLAREDKAALAARSGAVAVDMESAGVAEAAREAGIPFCVIRAVSDPADFSLPGEIPLISGPRGQARPLALLGCLARRPSLLPELVRLARNYAAALRSLRRVGRALDRLAAPTLRS